MTQTKHKHRRVAVVPAAKRDAANEALERLGWGPDNFGRPLYPPSAHANSRPTHYAADIALTPRMLEQLEAVVKSAGGRCENVGGVREPRRLERAAAAAGAKPTKPT